MYRDANICTPIEYEFSIINLINAITPNGDGINDVLDYSDLRVKKDVKISIFDRFGKKCIPAKNNPITFGMEQKTEETSSREHIGMF